MTTHETEKVTSSTSSLPMNNDENCKMKKPARRRIIRRRGRSTSGSVSGSASIPSSLTENQDLTKAISALPTAYDFEILKTLWRIHQANADVSSNIEKNQGSNNDKAITHVALQMPEGLLMYACTIADIIQKFSGPLVKTVSILGDVTYGACCVDDLGAQALGADLLVHYGHSCLIPVTNTVIPCLYVFVEIQVDVNHLVDCFCETIPLHKDQTLNGNADADADPQNDVNSFESRIQVEVMGTVQFRAAVTHATKLLKERKYIAHIPQAKPLSPGEVLGCTAPSNLANIATDFSISDVTEPNEDSRNIEKVMLFIADGRFHLEAAMIANPTLAAYRYDPYAKKLTLESYETTKMKEIRLLDIEKAKSAHTFGIVLGTLGRQGNPAILSHVRQILRSCNKRYFIVLLSEITPHKLRLMSSSKNRNVDAWIQIACPRLSVDWGHFFDQPILTAYELEVCLNLQNWKDVYPMDFYSNGKTNYTKIPRKKEKNNIEGKSTRSLTGRWSNYHDENRTRELCA